MDINSNKHLINFKPTGLLTELTIHDIENKLVGYFGGIRGRNICVPNISWGIFSYEMDFAIVTPKLSLTEVEIKRSWSDFMADFKKRHYHDDKHVKKFYYCVPEAMKQEVQDWCKDIYIGILYYTEDGEIHLHVEPKIRIHCITLNNEEFFKLSRLATIRFWVHREKTIKTADEKTKEDLRRTKDLLTEIKCDFKQLNDGVGWRAGIL